MSLSFLINDYANAHHSLPHCLEFEKPAPGRLVLAVERAGKASGRQYVVANGSEDYDAYGATMEHLNSYYVPGGRNHGSVMPYALHEVVREGLPRRVMFDIDYAKPVKLETLKSHVALLERACAAAYESYGNIWETALDTNQFSLTVSDACAPFKGFHLLLLSAVMPAKSVARMYVAVKELLSLTAEGQLLAAAIDPKPATETFNMRLYGSHKISHGRPVRQKRIFDIDYKVYYDEYVNLQDYLIQPDLSIDRAGGQFIHNRALHPDDELAGRSATHTVIMEEHADARFAECELLEGWTTRGDVQCGEHEGRGWWRQNLTFTGGERKTCSVCDRVHETRTDYLWLTGEGLVDESKAIYVRCRARAQTAEEKEAGNYRYNVVAKISAVKTSLNAEPAPVPAPVLKYEFVFDGYTGKALKTPLTAFLAAQKLAHVAAIDALDRSAETKRAEKAQLNLDLATAVAHQIGVMERALEAQKDEESKQALTGPLYDALDELEEKGADYSIYGQRDFNTLGKRVYKNEYELLCTIHCNAWTHDQEGAAYWSKGRWESKNWDERRVAAQREQMRFRTVSGAQYGGKGFWMAIVKAYARASQTSFTPYPMGRSAIGLPSPVLWQMYDGMNNYAGLRACPMPLVDTNSQVHSQHLATFEHYLRSQIAGEGDEYYRYSMGWLASAMQRPHEKTGVALLIRGPQGCGKSLFVSLLARIVPHASMVTNKGLTTLTDRFNTDLDNKTLYMFGEAPEARHVSHDQLAAIKTIITDDSLHIEAKNKTIEQKKQYLNLIVCSNMLNCIETSEGDRRWCVLNTPFPVHEKDDREYWERVWPLFTKDMAFAASVQQLLLNYNLDGWSAKEYPKSEALQATRNELPIVNYALGYPQLQERVTKYLANGGYEADRPATLGDIVMCHRLDEGDSARGDTSEQQVKDLYYAVCNVPQLKERFSFHPDNDGGRMTHVDSRGCREVLKHAIIWGADGSLSEEVAGFHPDSSAVRDRDAAMAKMVAMLRTAGLDVSEFTNQFPALGDGPDRYDSMGKSQLLALARERKITLVRNPTVALMRSKLRESDLKA